MKTPKTNGEIFLTLALLLLVLAVLKQMFFVFAPRLVQMLNSGEAKVIGAVLLLVIYLILDSLVPDGPGKGWMRIAFAVACAFVAFGLVMNYFIVDGIGGAFENLFRMKG